MAIREKKERQEMEARIQTNLDLINKTLLSLLNRGKPVNAAELEKKFKLPIYQKEGVQNFESVLENDLQFKQNLVIINIKRMPSTK